MAESVDATHSRHVPPGMTRDCTDPWTYLEIGGDGSVRPCCVRPPVGNVLQAPASAILQGEAIRRLRRDLLSAAPDAICRGCGLAGLISAAGLQAKVAALLAQVSLPDGFAPDAYLQANPDVARAGIDAQAHFLASGRLEGRSLAPKP